MKFHVFEKKVSQQNVVVVHGAYNDICYAKYASVESLKKHWLNMKYVNMCANDYKMSTAQLKDDTGNTFTIFPIFGFWFANEVVRDLAYARAVWEGQAKWPYDPTWHQTFISQGLADLVTHATQGDYETYMHGQRMQLGSSPHKKSHGVVITARYSPVWPIKKTLMGIHAVPVVDTSEECEPWSPDFVDEDEDSDDSDEENP